MLRAAGVHLAGQQPGLVLRRTAPTATRHPGTSKGFLEGWVGTEHFGPALDMFPPPSAIFLAWFMLRMPGVWLRLPAPAQLFLPAGR